MAFDAHDPAWAPLIAAAVAVRARAYAPYSGYLVGAAVLASDGAVFAGCNVENASYGGTICAERNAVWHAVASGQRRFSACVVVTRGPNPGAPCGMCRQVLVEFEADLPILLVAWDDTAGHEAARRHATLSGLLPDAFRPSALAPGDPRLST